MAGELAPKAHMIHSIISNNWSPHAALAELVDNAFAAGKGGADEIWIDIQRDGITVWDHGRGVDDINRLFQLGNTSSWNDLSDIGLYGVGATHSAIWLGGTLCATTVRDGIVYQHEADWDRCIRRRRWPAKYTDQGKRARRSNVPKQLLADGKVTSGTLLEIGRRRRGGRGFHLEKLLERLGFMFSPGLRLGKKIHVRRNGAEWVEAAPFSPPDLTEVVEFESEVAGMPYRCRAGLMLPPVLRYNGFFYGFTHRILERTKEPFQDHGSSMFYAEVQLGPEWRTCIADHKNAVARYREELAGDLHEHCKELIDRGREFEHELQIEELESVLQQIVDGMLRTDRGRGDGTPEPGSPRPPQKEATDSNPADRTSREGWDSNGEEAGRPSGVVLKFESLPVISLCEEQGARLYVRLNKEDHNIRHAMAEPANSWGLISQAMAAVSSHLLAAYIREGDSALEQYMPRIGSRLHPGMEPNEVAAEIMTTLMSAFPNARNGSPGSFREAA